MCSEVLLAASLLSWKRLAVPGKSGGVGEMEIESKESRWIYSLSVTVCLPHNLSFSVLGNHKSVCPLFLYNTKSIHNWHRTSNYVTCARSSCPIMRLGSAVTHQVQNLRPWLGGAFPLVLLFSVIFITTETSLSVFLPGVCHVHYNLIYS